MRFLLAFVLVASARAWDETVDRVVASVGNVAITERDLERESRLEAFLGDPQAPQALSKADWDRVRDRLIDQTLLAQEAEIEGVGSEEASKAAAQALADVRKRYSSEEAYQSALRTLGMTEAQVLERLRQHDRILRLIDRRLRPAASVTPAEIEAYYRETFLPGLARHGNNPAPPLAEVEGRIREILIQKKIDQQLAEWLAQLRTTHRARIHSF